MKQRDKIFLLHIAEAIAKIEKYSDGVDEEAFMKADMLQDAVIRQFEIIGEAVKNLSEEIRLQTTRIPWKQMARMRDFLIHHYFSIDIERIWITINNDLPDLKINIDKIRGSDS